jgi:periplasmic divalent cation tolerance protein
MTDKLLIFTTAGSDSEAERIATALVERKLAACVNVVPRIQSVYRWHDKVETAEEFLLVIKTVKTQQEQVQSVIRELHSYELPECVAIAVDSGSTEYLDWITGSVK